MGEVRSVQGRTVLVTGASGLIGSAVVEELLVRGARVVGAGRSIERLRKRFGIRDGLSFIPYDARKDSGFDFAVDFMIIAASPASPDLFMTNPVDVMVANTVAVNGLLSFAVRSNVKKVVYVSSSEVYGRIGSVHKGLSEECTGEVDISSPRSCYAESKRAGELLCVSFASQYGLDVSIVRPGHVYGPTATENDRRVSSLWPRMAIRGEDIVMKSNGMQIRSYVHCHDCATAIITVLEKGASSEAYNISNRRSVVAIRDLAEEICKIAGVNLVMEVPDEIERKAFNPMLNSALDASKLESLGWCAQYDLRGGLEDTIRTLKLRAEGE